MKRDPRHGMELTAIDASWLLHELAGLWSVELSDLFDDAGNLLPLAKIPPNAQKLIAGFEAKSTVIGQTEDGDPVHTRLTKVKLIDRLAVLRDIGKHVDVSAFNRAPDEQLTSSMASLLNAVSRAMDRANPQPDSSRADEIDVTPIESVDPGGGQGSPTPALQGKGPPSSSTTEKINGDSDEQE